MESKGALPEDHGQAPPPMYDPSTQAPGGGYVGPYPSSSNPQGTAYPTQPGGAAYTTPQSASYPNPAYAPGGAVVMTTHVQPPPGPKQPLPCSYIVSLVFAILSFFLGCWILAIPAIVFAVLAVVMHPNDPRAAKTQCLVGMGLTIASFVISIIIIIVIVVLVVQAANEVNDINKEFDWSHAWN